MTFTHLAAKARDKCQMSLIHETDGVTLSMRHYNA